MEITVKGRERHAPHLLRSFPIEALPGVAGGHFHLEAAPRGEGELL